MKKNKKGFTLVELLAVIVVLVIISVLAINKISSVMKTNNEKTTIANGTSYVKAVNGNSETSRLTKSFTDGIYSVGQLSSMGVKLSGTTPGEGIIFISGGKVMAACLNYKKNTYIYSLGESSVEKNKQCNDFSFIKLSQEFAYTGDVQQYVVPMTGNYKLQVWGAQGGYRSNTSYGGAGGYAEGIIPLVEGEVIYVYVGGSGNTGGTAGGFNGGGPRDVYNGGGGATDMRIEGDTLYHRIIVAGGGGSDGVSNNAGKAGGGLTGISASGGYGTGGDGATQTAAGTGGSFGIGGTGIAKNNGYGGAGGGGWYGGGRTTPDGSGDDDRGGGGGSGFVYTGANNVPSGYAVKKHSFQDYKILDGEQPNIPTHDGTSVMTGQKGDGYAKISLDNVDINTTIYSNPGSNTYIAENAGNYKIEVWGAQGGEAMGRIGGYGAYAVGEIHLNANEKLYVNVGGMGESTADAVSNIRYGGYNGGGNSRPDGATGWGAGGGASSVSKTAGLLSTVSSSNVIIVAGGGGGGGTYAGSNNKGGNAGGISGNRGDGNCGGYGGTQTAGGSGCGGSAVTGSYGQGASVTGYTSGGGGGYYGGGTGYDWGSGGGGGSSYIGNSRLTNKSMYCYNCTEDDNTDTKTISVTCSSTSARANCAKEGNGLVKITYLNT